SCAGLHGTCVPPVGDPIPDDKDYQLVYTPKMMSGDSAPRLKRLRTRAAERGLRMTPQREVLLRLLSQTRTHPTADELFRKVRRQLPSVSHATVYRNLQQL